VNARRSLILALGAVAVAAPLGALGQQHGKVHRVGVLSARQRPASLDTDYYGAFPRRMRELGYIEGKNLSVEWRFADGEYARLPRIAAELVQLKVDVILALGPPGAAAAQKATTTIPIIMVVSSDPVAAGFVKSLARPGGNITGLSNLAGDLSPKHLELLHVMVPKLARVGVLLNPANSAHGTIVSNVQTAAQKIAIKVVPAKASTLEEVDGAFATMVRESVGAVIVALDPFFIQQVHGIAARAARLGIPSIFANREYAEAGGLMSYGQNQVEIYRRAADYVDKIFKGAKPHSLPVEQPTQLELLINRKTADALGLSIPRSLLVSADRVIE